MSIKDNNALSMSSDHSISIGTNETLNKYPGFNSYQQIFIRLMYNNTNLYDGNYLGGPSLINNNYK